MIYSIWAELYLIDSKCIFFNNKQRLWTYFKNSLSVYKNYSCEISGLRMGEKIRPSMTSHAERRAFMNSLLSSACVEERSVHILFICYIVKKYMLS